MLLPFPVAQGLNTSVVKLILGADPVVKLVILLLLGMSVASWSIIVYRSLLLRRAWKQSVAFLDRFWSTSSLEQAHDDLNQYPDSPVAFTFGAGYRELLRLNEVESQAGGGPMGGNVDNVGRALRKAASESLTRLERTIPFLASCGSAAPFIGLFGTVWGILRAFQTIGAKGTTSITDVGPPIAEALIATAIGLFAAIPAVLFFNYFATRLKVMASEINHFSADFLNLVQRHERSRMGARRS